MKRRLMGMLVACMLLVIGPMNAYAAPSPGTEAALKAMAERYLRNVQYVTAASATSGTVMSMKVEAVTTSILSEATDIVASCGSYEDIFSIVDIKPDSTVASATIKKGVTVGFSISGVKYGDNIYVLHKRSSDREWEILKPTYIESNYLEVKMYSFSPVAIVKYRDGVTLTPTPQDTSAEEADLAEREAQELATRLISISVVSSSTGDAVPASKKAAGVDDVAYIKAQARLHGGSLIGMADCSTTTAAATLAKGIQVTLRVSGMNGGNVYVYHKRANSWETLKPYSVVNDYLAVKMYSLSPIAVVWYPTGVNIALTEQDTSAEEADRAEKEAKELADKMKDISVVASSTGNQLQTSKQTASVADVAYAKSQASLRGGSVIGMADYSTAAANAATVAKGVQVTLRVTGLNAGDNVYVLHKRANGWEILKPYSVINGYLAVKMYSLSPIAVVWYPAGVNITPTEQDTSAEDQEREEREVQELAGKITRYSGNSSAGSMSITKADALMSDVAFAKAQAAPLGGTIIGMAKFTTTTSDSVIAQGIRLSLGVTDLKAGDNIYVLHKLANGSWETLKPYSIVNGYLEVQMYSLSTASPIAVVRYPAGVTLTTTPQDTPSINYPVAGQDAQDYANRITLASAISSAGAQVTLTKGTSSTTYVAIAKGIAEPMGGTIIGMADFTTTTDAYTIANGILATLYVYDLQIGDNIYILHMLSDGTWETIRPYVVGSGYVTFRLYSLSPIAVVRYPAGVYLTPTQQIPTNPGTTNPGTTNPGTTNPGTTNPGTTNPGWNPGMNPGWNPGLYPNQPGGNQNNSQNNTQNQTNDNNQSNSQTNNQNNPVNVNQNVTVTYPDTSEQYSNGYGAGYKDGFNAGKNGSTSSSNGGTTVKSPKTDAALPALPFIAMFAAAGLAVCKKKNS